MQHNPFDEQVVRAVIAHMDADHAADCLAIVRHFGARPDATAARMVSLDGAGADFDLVVPSGRDRARVDWSRPLTERVEIREELARMVHELEDAGPDDGV